RHTRSTRDWSSDVCSSDLTVVSDLVLSDDPVLDAVCPADGLIVRAAGSSVGVTIDLSGKTLRGSGNGAGVWVVNGGAGGARVVGWEERRVGNGGRGGVAGG